MHRSTNQKDKRRRLKSVWLLTIAVLMMVVSACGQATTSSEGDNNAGENTQATQKNDSSSQGTSKEAIKIGVFLSTSGGAAPLGKPEMDTLKMLVDSKNASGGINGREIRLITYDDKSDQNEAVLAAKKLIESDKVVAVIGGTTSGNAMATLPLFEKAHIPYISLASSKQITFPDDGSPRHWIFKTAPGDDIVIKRLLSYMKGQEWKNVAWLNVDNAFGSSGHTEFKHYAPEYGVQAVLEETFEASVDDAKALLTRVKKANPDAVIVWGTAQESAVVIKNIAELNLGIPVLASHGIGTSSFIDLAGKAANGVVFPIGRIVVWKELPEDDPQKAVLAAYDEQYRAAFGSAPSTFGGHAWDAFHLLTKAIEDAGDDSEAIRDALEAQQRFVGVTGIFHYTPDDHTGLSAESMVIAEIVDGTFRLKER